MSFSCYRPSRRPVYLHGRQTACSDSGAILGSYSALTSHPDSGCTRRPAVSRSRIAPYRSLTRLSLDVIRVARRTSAEMPIGSGTVSRWVRAAVIHPPGFDSAPLGEFEGNNIPLNNRATRAELPFSSHKRLTKLLKKIKFPSRHYNSITSVLGRNGSGPSARRGSRGAQPLEVECRDL